MFVIHKNQLDAYKVPFRKKAREKMCSDIKMKGFGKVYDDARDLLIEDHKGNITRISFSKEYVPEKITKPSGAEYKFRFDNNDRLSSFLFPGDEKIHFHYEKELLKGIQINNGLIRVQYDQYNRIINLVYPDTKNISFSYSASGKISSIINRAKEKRSFETIVKDNKAIYKNTDALGRITQFQTDNLRKINKIVFPDSKIMETLSDKKLNTENIRLRNNTEMVIYKNGKLPSKVQYEDGSFINVSCDSTGRVNALENENGSIGYKYNEKQKLVSESFRDKEVAYKYDKNDLLSAMVYSSGLVVKYYYDQDSRINNVQISNKKYHLSFGTNDTVSEIHYPNGLVEHRRSKLLSGLKESVIKNGMGKTISHKKYDYDSLEMLVKYTSHDLFSKPDELHFTYDAETRLTECKDILSGKTETYRYDKKGNIIQDNGVEVKVGVMDEILSVGNKQIGYDKAGNVCSYYGKNGVLVTLRFNDAGVLKFSKVNNQVWEYWYDALGRRIRKSNGEGTFNFSWSGDKLLSEEYNGNGQKTLREYIYLPDNFVPIGFKENEKLFWLHTDVRNAVCSVTNENGEVVWNAGYGAFGEAAISVNKIRQPWRLAVQYFDDETGLHYNFARYYHPTLKTYLSIDPRWNNIEASNYSYALNNPFNRIDPHGNLSFGWSAINNICINVTTSIVKYAVATAVAIVTTNAAVVVGAVAGGTALLAGLAKTDQEKQQGYAASEDAAKAAVAIFVGGLILSGRVGDVAGSLYENSLKNEDTCIPCSLKSITNPAISKNDEENVFEGLLDNL